MFRLQTLLIAALIGIGATGALVFNWPASETEEARVNPTEKSTSAEQDWPLPAQGDAAPESLLQSDVANATGAPDFVPSGSSEDMSAMVVSLDSDHVELGDRYLLVGNHVAAWRAYTQATNQLKGVAPSPLLLRLAISAEQSGNLVEAASLYQKVVKHSGSQVNNRLMALSGLARIMIQDGQLDQAVELLSELYLREGTVDHVPDEIRYQIVYQLGTAVSQKYISTQKMEYGDVRRTEFHWSEPDIERMLELAPTLETPAVPPAISNEMRMKVLQRPNSQITLIAIDASTRVALITELIREIANQANVQFDISPRAHAVLSGRSARLNVGGVPLATVVDSLVVPLGLAWRQDGEIVQLQHASEIPETLVAFQLQHADRSLRRIELSMTRNLRRDSTLLHRGNISLISRDLASATVRYRELQKLTPNGDLAAKLSYNMAMLDLAESRADDAISKLYYSVDQSLDHAIQAASYARIGELELAKGNLDGAIYAAARGMALASDEQVRQDIVLTMARSYLLKSDPFSANKILFDNADSITDQSANRKAAVLSAYARYLGAPAVEGLQNQAARLIIALTSITPEDTANFVDALLIGRAFFEVGFTGRSTELMEQAQSEATREFWRRKIAYEVGTHHYRAGELVKAEKVFAGLASGDDEIGIKAKLKWAEISLASDAPERSLEVCKQLWTLQLDHSQKVATLSLMGKSYQQLGRYRAAAVCFSGMVPHKEIEEADAKAERSGNSSRRRTP